VVRADQRKPGLLYAGTEYGMFISYDDGAHWKSFQQNLPVVPVTDLTIKNNDLIVATQGRAFWMIDDLTMVQDMQKTILNQPLHLYPVDTVYRMPSLGRSFPSAPVNAGTNAPSGAVINFYAKNVEDSTKASVSILDKNHQKVKTFATDAKEKNNKLEIRNGMNQFVWNFRYPESETMEGMILWNGVPSGIIAPPGSYFAKVTIGRDSAEVPFTIKADPNYNVKQEEYEQQFAFLKAVQEKFNETQKAIKDIRSLRLQINDFIGRQGKDVPKEVKAAADSINKHLTAVEETLYQTKAKSGQDVLNYPIRLNDKLSGVFDVANSGNFAPSKQAKEVYNDLAAQIDVQLAKLKNIREKDIPAFNALVREKSLPVIKASQP
jgi:hypothetical protein